jgi:D-3-phosphoglycerate dehydrogenase
MSKIYVTPRSVTKNGHPSLEKLKKAGYEIILARPGIQPSEEEQMKILPECIAYLAGIEPITEKVMRCAKHLKVISRNGVGIENIDLEAARRLGIEIKIAAGANSQGVAELAIALILSSVRSIPLCNTRIKSGEWKREEGIEIKGKTLGVIGCGNIGKKVIEMALGLNMKVLGFDLKPDSNFKPSPAFNYTSLEELFKNSDIISIHIPPDEKPLIEEKSIATMKQGVIIINTARAGVVNKQDIINALNRGKVRTYATDVYEIEPPEVDSLIKHEHTITTPHIGGYTLESIDRAVEAAVENILSVIQRNTIDLEKLPLNSLESFFKNPEIKSEKIDLVWLGQAGFALRYEGKTILIDPYLSDYLSKKYNGKIFPHIRLMEIPISTEKIKNLDLVCCTHAHSDHMDPETVSVLSKNNPKCRFILPAAEINEAVNRGIKKEQIMPINANQELKIDMNINIMGIAASHETFKINNKGEHHFLGYRFSLGDLRIYHSGDCIPYEGLMEKLKDLKIDVALLPINGRDDFRLKNGIAGNFKIPEVIQLSLKAGFKLLIVHHFGMFDYNTVSDTDLKELRNKSSKSLQIIIPEINLLYSLIKNN